MQALVDAPGGLDGPMRACAILLLGWSKMRIRRSQDAVELLSEAILRCRAEGLHDLVDRARSSLTFSRAFGGDFAGALAGTFDGFDDAWAGAPIGATEGIVVLVGFFSGVDGLNTVVPHANALYYDQHGSLAIPPVKCWRYSANRSDEN